MTHVPSLRMLFLGALAAAPAALAQTLPTEATPPLTLELPETPPLNRFGLSYRMGFNTRVSFKNLGGFAPLSAGGQHVTPNDDPYNYDNGYVLVDASGNAFGSTRYWGYESASQISGHEIVMQRSSSEATASSDNHSADLTSGAELTYNREFISRETWHGGLEGAFGYTYLCVKDARPESADVTRVDDTYQASQFQGNYSPWPDAPYRGESSPLFRAPTLVAARTGSTTEVLPGAALITGQREFTANMFGFRAGPYLEMPFSKSIAFTLSGGFALVYVNSEFRYNETVTIQGVGSVVNRGSGSASGWLPGAYIAGNFSVALSDKWSLTAGAQFEDVGKYSQKLNGKQVMLDLSNSIFVTVGLTYSF